ncbi:MAG: undecaprenyl/decaprenyl-phosphate alpha-N-acetylglucosaminyl 1-phosphate transferase [Allobaculum sp.]|nr:undecaprenyl/decaprenyl-phosphate alpha-N-acetylglucosaminyl 1-phosphate transferase [Allobaculum sp.]
MLTFVVPFVLSALLIPIVKIVSKWTDAWAKQNNRTIHHGIISRIGGIAIYFAFVIGLLLFFTPDRSTMGVFLTSSMMFLIGLWDDFLDLPAKMKFGLQLLAALILLYFGVGVDTLRIFRFSITNPFICGIFTILWIVGITNAINLLDGLDGLCGGMILVVLSVVSAISIVDRRGDIILLSLILMGAILGFLLYNSHPASIFMGDCGSLFLGSTIAALSLLGFKSSTMMTLGFPILILVLPIIDTFSAILRRKIKKIPVDQADRSHLHHQLMSRFGQTHSVIIMCGITFGFGMSAFLYISNRKAGLLMMAILFVGIELFIERTGMISPHFHPAHSSYRLLKRTIAQATHPVLLATKQTNKQELQEASPHVAMMDSENLQDTKNFNSPDELFSKQPFDESSIPVQKAKPEVNDPPQEGLSKYANWQEYETLPADSLIPSHTAKR